MKYVSLCVIACTPMAAMTMDLPGEGPELHLTKGQLAVIEKKRINNEQKNLLKQKRNEALAIAAEKEKERRERQAKLDKESYEKFLAEGKERRERQAKLDKESYEKKQKQAEKRASAIAAQAAQKAEEERLRRENENEARKRIEFAELAEKENGGNLDLVAIQLVSKPAEGIVPEDVFAKVNKIIIGLGGILVLEGVSNEIYPIPIQARLLAECLWCNGVNIAFGKPVVKSPVRNMARGASIASIVFSFSSLGSCLRANGGCFDSDAAAGCRRLFLYSCILGGLVKPVVSYANAHIHSKNYDPSGLVIGALIGLALLDPSLFSHEDLYSNMERVFSLATVGDFARLLIGEV